MQRVAIGRVSPTMKRVAVAVALAAIAAALWYLRSSSSSTSVAAPSSPVATPGPAAASPNVSPDRATPIAKVTKLSSVDERERLAERIANARSARAAIRAPGAPSLPAEAVEANQLETLKVEIRTAMREVVPILADCYESALPALASPDVDIVAELTLTGDPDVGTLIDAKQVTDKAGMPLPATFDDCLRSTFQTLALPPLAEGDHVEVRYPFVFRQD